MEKPIASQTEKKKLNVEHYFFKNNPWRPEILLKNLYVGPTDGSGPRSNQIAMEAHKFGFYWKKTDPIPLKIQDSGRSRWNSY